MLILVVAGDPSGDLHGAHLIAALKRREKHVRVLAVGGPLMKAETDEFIEDLASRGVTGFLEPALKLKFLYKLAKKLEAIMVGLKPDLLVCIDFYGFNRRVLGLAKNAGIPAVYYVSPQVWASRPGRVQVLKKLVRKMLVIFPFEERLYKQAGVPVEFVGHPLVDLVPVPREADAPRPTLRVGILPGSRRSEVARHLPLMLAAFERLRGRRPAQGFVFASPSLPDSVYAPARAAGVKLVREQDYAERRELDIALCSSGTATLENALLGLPMVVVYKLSWGTYLIARALVRVKNIAMANILCGRTVVPELIQSDATVDRVSGAAYALIADAHAWTHMRSQLSALRGKLGGGGAAERAADAALKIASETSEGRPFTKEKPSSSEGRR